MTTLTREGLPLIRYRTHDVTRVLSRDPCGCGRTHLRIDRLRGRTDDMVIVKGTNFYPRQIESLVLRRRGAGHEYQILLERGASGDSLAVLVEAGEGWSEGEADRLRLDIRTEIGLSADIRVLREGEIPRPQGKSVRVIDRR